MRDAIMGTILSLVLMTGMPILAGERSPAEKVLQALFQHEVPENNFAAGHHDGFRNMMCMGIEVENFARYRTIRFSYKTALRGEQVLLFRIYDRTGGWIDWTIPHPDTAGE